MEDIPDIQRVHQFDNSKFAVGRRLAFDKFGSKAHTFSPAYTDYEIEEIAACSSHLTFNSLTQYERLHEKARKQNPEISLDCASILSIRRLRPTYITHVRQAHALE